MGFVRRHPILLLLALTPGIPEYLSGSSRIDYAVRFPGLFLVFLLLNLGLYGPGVLLVREAHVRWRKGWSTILLLGAAYALLEEGTALSTLFNPSASVVGGLGFYGHAGGISWIWLIGILMVHIVLSVGLPIVLLGLALPETRGRPLLSQRGIAVALAVYAADIAVLAAAVHYAPGYPFALAAVGVALELWLLAWWLPAGLLDPPTPGPRRAPAAFFVYGIVLFPAMLVIPAVGGTVDWPAPLTGGLDAAFGVGLFLWVRQEIGRSGHAAHLVMLAAGSLLPIMAFGLIGQLDLPLVLVADLLAVAFFVSLWRRYRPRPTVRSPIPGATAV